MIRRKGFFKVERQEMVRRSSGASDVRRLGRDGGIVLSRGIG